MPSFWNSTLQFPNAVNLTVYIASIVVAVALFYFIWIRGKAAGFVFRWTTQDILVLAIMGVLLEVYDNLIGDQFITPLINLLPIGSTLHDFAINDLPYMFLLMVGIALIRKPYVATALVFLNFLLMQVLFPGSRSNVLWWPYGIYQGLLVDVYFVARGKGVFTKPGTKAFFDGLAMGALRAVPAVTLDSIFFSPWISSYTRTVGNAVLYNFGNAIGNGLEAALMAGLAIYIAHSVSRTSTHEVVASDPEPEAVVSEVSSEGSAS